MFHHKQKIIVFISSLLLIYAQNDVPLLAYNAKERCELAFAAARIPLILASKVSKISQHEKRALILSIMTHATRSAAEILHMHNRPQDLRHHMYACIAYDAAGILSDIKQLSAKNNPYDNEHEDDSEPLAPAAKKKLQVIRDLLLPTIEGGTALYRSIENRTGARQCKNRLIADASGALARAVANIMEDHKGTPEQIFAALYLIYTVYYLFADYPRQPGNAMRIPTTRPYQPATTARMPAWEQLNFAPEPTPAAWEVAAEPPVAEYDPTERGPRHELNMAELERQFGGWDYPHQRPPTRMASQTAPATTIATDTIINTEDPISQEPFTSGAHVRRLACGHGIHQDSLAMQGASTMHDCPLCRQPRDYAREHTITYHASEETAEANSTPTTPTEIATPITIETPSTPIVQPSSIVPPTTQSSTSSIPHQSTTSTRTLETAYQWPSGGRRLSD